MDSILKPPEDLKLRNLTSGVSLPLKRVGGDIPGIPWGPVSPQTPNPLPQQLRLPFLSAAAMFASPGGSTVTALLWVGDGGWPQSRFWVVLRSTGVDPVHRPPSTSCFPLPRTSRHVGSWVSGSPRGQGAKARPSLHPEEPPGGFSPPGDWRSPLSELRVLTADMCGSECLCSGRKKTSLGHKSILAPRTCSVGI